MNKRYLMIVLLMAGVSVFGVSKAIKDTLQHHYSKSVFVGLNPQFWNPAESWKNKYADWDGGDQRPAFPFAENLLVAFTDAWHLFDLISIIAILAAGMAASALVWLSNRPGRAWFIWGLFTLISGIAVFHVFYTWILV